MVTYLAAQISNNGLSSTLIHILLPLDGKGVLLLIVTILTCGDKVILCRFPAAYNRHNMVHGEFLWRHLISAVITPASAAFLLPPLCLPYIPCLLLLLPDILLSNRRDKIIHYSFTNQAQSDKGS